MRHFEHFDSLAVTYKGRQNVASEADLERTSVHFLAGDGLWTGNRIVAGPSVVFPALEGVLGEAAS